MSNKNCLVVFTSQPGATIESFDEAQCCQRVGNPLKDILKNSVAQVAVLVDCTPGLSTAEASHLDSEEREEPPVPLATPTSTFLRKFLLEYYRTTFQYQCLPLGKNSAGSYEYLAKITSSWFGGGARKTLIILDERLIPSPEELSRMFSIMENTDEPSILNVETT